MYFFIFKQKKGAKKLGLGQAVVARHNLIGLKENFHGLIPGNRSNNLIPGNRSRSDPW